MTELELDFLCDERGFLIDPDRWAAEIAEAIAAKEGIHLTPAHWEVLNLLRSFYAEFDESPANRALVNWVKRHVGSDKGNSIYLMHLFPGSPARVGSRIAGLPKPKNCL